MFPSDAPRSVGVQYATGDQWRNNSRKNEGMEPKQKQHPAVDVTVLLLSSLFRDEASETQRNYNVCHTHRVILLVRGRT